MDVRLASVFLPVTDPAASAGWFSRTFDLTVGSVESHAAVLRRDGSFALTLLGPASGISATPGLDWAPLSFVVDDLDAFRARCADGGTAVSDVEGDPAVCRFVTVHDPDGNTLLVVDR